MTINVLQAAKYLGQQTDWRLTRLEMQKIIYLAHMLYLGRTGMPLVEGNFEAWKYGPVHPDLYYVTNKSNSLKPNKRMFSFVQDLNSTIYEMETSVLDRILTDFSPGDGWKLVRVTHWEGSAWTKNYRKHEQAIIPESDIKQEYKKRHND